MPGGTYFIGPCVPSRKAAISGDVDKRLGELGFCKSEFCRFLGAMGTVTANGGWVTGLFKMASSDGCLVVSSAQNSLRVPLAVRDRNHAVS